MPLKERERNQAPSPSTRRAWIEISSLPFAPNSFRVALHPEGVDRNLKQIINVKAVPAVALHPEGVDRNIIIVGLT